MPHFVGPPRGVVTAQGKINPSYVMRGRSIGGTCATCFGFSLSSLHCADSPVVWMCPTTNVTAPPAPLNFFVIWHTVAWGVACSPFGRANSQPHIPSLRGLVPFRSTPNCQIPIPKKVIPCRSGYNLHWPLKILLCPRCSFYVEFCSSDSELSCPRALNTLSPFI